MKAIRENIKTKKVSIFLASLLTESQEIIHRETKPKIDDSK
jgi:hypothetical protein